MKNDNTGSISFTFLTLTLVFISRSTALIHVFAQWRKQAAEQIKVSHCVATEAIRMKRQLNSLKKVNLTMKTLRKIAFSALLTPSALAGIRSGLKMLRTYQNLEILYWKIQSTQWKLKAGCAKPIWRLNPLPKFPWRKPPPDWLGPRPLIWNSKQNEFRIQSGRETRRAAATIFKDQSFTWKLKWTHYHPQTPMDRAYVLQQQTKWLPLY